MKRSSFFDHVALSRERVLNHPGHSSQKSHGRKGGYAAGGNLMKRGAAQLATDVVAGRSGFAGSRDPAMSVIASRQGFDGPPEVVSRAEMDRLIRSGRPEMLRGAHAPVDSDDNPVPGGKTGGQINEEMRSGDAAFGRGVYGNGYYFAPPRGEGFAGAENFADGTPGSLARATLRADAKIVKYAQIRREHDEYFASLGHEAFREGGLERNPDGPGYRRAVPKSDQDLVFSDLGRFAAARGYDAVEMNDTKAGGHIPPQWLVVNRTALVVEEA